MAPEFGFVRGAVVAQAVVTLPSFVDPAAAEIAQLVGRSKRTVERGLQQARTRLKDFFDEDWLT